MVWTCKEKTTRLRRQPSTASICTWYEIFEADARTRWIEVVRRDMAACEVSDADVVDRAKWKPKIKKADPTTM